MSESRSCSDLFEVFISKFSSFFLIFLFLDLYIKVRDYLPNELSGDSWTPIENVGSANLSKRVTSPQY